MSANIVKIWLFDHLPDTDLWYKSELPVFILQKLKNAIKKLCNYFLHANSLVFVLISDDGFQTDDSKMTLLAIQIPPLRLANHRPAWKHQSWISSKMILYVHGLSKRIQKMLWWLFYIQMPDSWILHWITLTRLLYPINRYSRPRGFHHQWFRTTPMIRRIIQQLNPFSSITIMVWQYHENEYTIPCQNFENEVKRTPSTTFSTIK